jgi:PTH1 family peptidyl-tRNA hydrolase
MVLIIGLGNPGVKYQNNRHNVGHLFVDYLIKELRITNNELRIVKTDCFMNLSGTLVNKLIRNSQFEIKNLLIVHDDLDIPLGKFHIQFASGPLLHNGLESVEHHLKTKDFWRVRIGVDARPLDRRIPGEAYSLQNFLHEEKKLLDTEVFPKIFSQLKLHLKNEFKVIA